jgi:hypothetical protein
MRLIPAVALALTGLATCSTPPRASEPNDLKIDLALALEGGKCVVRFVDTRLKEPAHAVAWTNHQVIWRIVKNGCGEKTAEKGGKALGLRHLKRKATGNPTLWFDRCDLLKIIPAEFKTPPEFRCYIPSKDAWPRGEPLEEHNEYEYEIDGDSVEPLDPGTDIRRNG